MGTNKIIYILWPHKIADLLSHLALSVFVSKQDVQPYLAPNSIQTIPCFHSGLRYVCELLKQNQKWMTMNISLFGSLPSVSIIDFFTLFVSGLWES